MQSTLHFQDLKNVHIIGICGTLMGAFAAFLKRQGVHVTGSDQSVYPPMSDVLKNEGIELFSGYREENLKNLPSRPDLVVIGNVISRSNSEASYAIREGFSYTSLPEAMEKLFLHRTHNIVVSGTHGKTTTSSLLAFVLSHMKKNPSFFIGGVSNDLPYSFHAPSIEEGDFFVLEGDEYDTAFWDKVPKFNHYLPRDVILTSIEFDHADIYSDLSAVEKAFAGLIQRIHPQGHLIACIDYPSVNKLISNASVPVYTYSAQMGKARFSPTGMRDENGWTHFRVWDSEKKVTSSEISIRLPGIYNILNALSVFIECQLLGLQEAEIIPGLKAFQGVKRRQEIKGEIKGIIVMDDFAHHPTAVRETLRALKNRYPEKRLIAVFEPRSATSRRKVFQNEFTKAFLSADQVFISAPYDQSKIAAEDQFSSEQLILDLQKQGKSAELFTVVDEGVKKVTSFVKPGDLVAVLSNGGFNGFIPKLLDSLKK